MDWLFILAAMYNQRREGAFREVYLARMPRETLIFKAYVWDSDFEYEDFEFMRFDAIVAEKLSSRWSDMIVGIYGFCGTAMINEAMENGDIEEIASPLGHRHTYKVPPEEEGQLIVKNELTGTQKLVYGLEMAEAVAVVRSTTVVVSAICRVDPKSDHEIFVAHLVYSVFDLQLHSYPGGVIVHNE